MSLAAVLFDLDGTLIDTAPDFHLLLNQMRQELGLPALDFHTVRPWVSEGAAFIMRQGLADLGPDPATLEHLTNLFLDRYADNPAQGSSLFPGFLPLLQLLEANQLPWGIVTNKRRRFCAPLLAALNIKAGCCICPDDVRKTKPDPEGLQLAAKNLRVLAEDCLYVGDHVRDIEAGRNAGMKTAVACWGYIPLQENPKHWQANILAANCQELVDYILSLRI